MRVGHQLPFRYIARAIVHVPHISVWVWFILASFMPVMLLQEAGKLTPQTFEEEWFSSDSIQKTERHAWASYRNDEPWDLDYVSLLVQGKKEYEGNDMATNEALAKLEEVIHVWFDLTVTISNGRTFDIFDMCYRGPALPDFPVAPLKQTQAPFNGPLYLPCLSISVLECFQEQKNFLHRGSYFQVDNDPSLVEFMLNMSLKPYSVRPSYKDKTPQEIKAILANSSDGLAGCPWYMQNVTFPLFTLLLGHSEHSNGLLTKAPYLFTAHFYDGPQRMAFRKLGATNPDGLPRSFKEEMDDFREAKKKHMNSFAASVVEISKASPQIEFIVLMPLAEEFARLQAETATFSGLQCCLIIIIQFLIVAMHLDMNAPRNSHCLIAGLGTLLSASDVAIAYGIYVYGGNHMLNGILMTFIPPLLLGAGLSDMSVFINDLYNLSYEELEKQTNLIIFEEVFARSGPPITIISIVRIMTFWFGTFVQLPVVKDTCTVLSIWAGAHYGTLMFIYTPLIAVEALRMKYSLPEPVCLCCQTGLCCSCCPARCVCSPDYKEKKARNYKMLFVKPYRRFFLQRPIHVGLTILGFILSILGIVGMILLQTPQFPVVAMSQRGSYSNSAFDVFFNNFGNFESYLVFWNVDVPKYQKDMLQMYDAVTQLDGCGPDMFPTFLSSFYATGGVGIDGFFNTSSWTHPTYAPLGIASTNEGEFYTQYRAWNEPVLSNISLYQNMTTSLTDANGFPDCMNDLVNAVYICANNSWIARSFVHADLANTNEFSYHAAEFDGNSQSTLHLSFMKFWNQVATAGPGSTAYMDIIQNTQDSIHSYSAFKDSQVFVKGILYDLGEASLQTNTIVHRQIIPLCLATLLVIPTVFLCSLKYGLLMTIASFQVFTETCGLLLCFTPSNVFLSLFEIIAVSMAGSDMAHGITVFSDSLGDKQQDRVEESVVLTLMSSMSRSFLMLSSAAITASFDVHFTFAYFCIPVVVLTLINMVNKLITVPSLLMTIEQIPCLRSKGHHEVTV